MRTLVALAVLGMFCALPHQAFSSQFHPRWPGPFAASIPAGVNGLVIPVSDTREVKQARRDFLNAFQKRLSALASTSRYAAAAAPALSASVSATANAVPPSLPVPSFRQAAGSNVPFLQRSSSPIFPSRIVVSRGHVQDTPEVAAAKSEFFALYNKLGAEAAAAPDDPVIYN